MARTLILTGGVSHPFADAAEALAGSLSDIGVSAEIETDLERGFAAWSGDVGFDLLIVYALRWRMLGDKYAAQREEWGFSLSGAARQMALDGVAGGRPLLGLHTAAICFDDWPAWRDILGGAWVWDRSFHPPYGPTSVAPLGVPHPIVSGLPPFEMVDEVYSDLAMGPEMVALATASAGSGDAKWPVLWTRQFGRGRVVCDLLGHDRAALEHPVHRRIVQRAAAWALGRADAEIAAL